MIDPFNAPKLRASPTGLAKVDKARKATGWTKTRTPAWWLKSYTTQATLRRFWHPEKYQIQREVFINICQAVGIDDWVSIVDRTPFRAGEKTPDLDWSQAPDVDSFYGRTDELSQLEQWIVQDRCKLVSVLGMGGIGKTTLVVALAAQVQEQFDFLIWRSLRNAPPLEELLTDLISSLSNQQLAKPADEEEQSIAFLLRELIECLKQQRCLVVLDNAEAICESHSLNGHYRPGDEGYGELLKRVGEEHHDSCLVLTSREQLTEITLLEVDTPRPLGEGILHSMNQLALAGFLQLE